MRTHIKSLIQQTKEHKANVTDSITLSEGEKALQVEMCKYIMRYLGNKEREYNRDSARLVQERIK